MAHESPGSLPPALHQMHATASRSGSLTTFDHLTAPLAPPSADEPKGAELAQSGLSSLYNRLRASVGGTREVAHDAAAGHRSPGGGVSAVSSPVVQPVPASRLQSPSSASFAEALPPSRESNLSTARSSLGGPQELPFAYSPTASHAKAPSTSTLDPPPRRPAGRDTLPENQSTSSPRLVPAKETAVRQQALRRDRPDSNGNVEEDDDDMVLVGDGKGAMGQSAVFKFPADPPRDSLSRVSSRTEPPKSRDAPEKVPDVPKPQHQPQQQLQIQPQPQPSASSARPSALAADPQRPPLLKVGPSHLPGFRPSRASSSDGLSSVITTSTVRARAAAPIEEIRRQTQAASAAAAAAHAMPRSTFTQMRRKILDREFWMRDENAKDCFNCGTAFTTFRRKHHCRTCGQIFDSKCTSIVSGKVFGQQSNLKVCKPCESIIYGHDDDSSEYSDDAGEASMYEQDEKPDAYANDESEQVESDHTKISTPTISIPMSRKGGSEKKRRSHVIEVGAPTLARPSSSRSLRSLGGRPRSSSHKRYHSRHQHMRHVKHDDRAPFHQYHDTTRSQPGSSAFHHDNIIDPDLAPFMSDDGSSEDEPASLFATLNEDPATVSNLEGERAGLGGLLAAMRKGKARHGDKHAMGGAYARDADNFSITSRTANRQPKRRNPSVSSITHRPSPRRSKSNTLLRPYTGYGHSGPSSQLGTPQLLPSPSATPPGTKMTRSASMQGITPKVELNKASLDHARKLLGQMLRDAGVPHVSSWGKALIPILRQCTDDVNPDVDRGDDIDVRNYIKLKKIPGGRPRDTAYVSGVVFTKNVALRSMPRSIPNPRIVIITFAIEYARHQTHFMSLDPVIAQEREYLRNLVSRIAALEPHVLLVQRNVSGLALEFLEKEQIAVVCNVKPSVLNAVARCTNSRMISSVDKLAIDPSQLGYCGSFDVKTYVHKKNRKTYIFLSGCQRELGCTIVLRGAENAELVKLKRITEFMSYVVYNLRLETCLMRDEFIDTPTTSFTGSLDSRKEEDTPINSDEQCKTSSTDAQHHQNDVRSGDAAPSYYSDMVENHRTKILSSSPFVKFMQPYLLEQAREYERKLGHLSKLKNQYTTSDAEKVEDPEKTADPEKSVEPGQVFELVQPEMVHTVVERASKQVREFLSAVHASEYDKAMHNYMTQRRLWETYLSGNVDLYDPFNHQKIAVLYSVVNTKSSTPCIGPEIIALGFYQEHDYDDGFTPDCTLGQYVEDLCSSAGVACEMGNCDKRMVDHSRQYVHGDGQMTVVVQKQAPKLKGMYQTILMWSCCRICGQETQAFPMSEWTWKYSFAKYLELTFWSTELHPRAGVCPHDIHRNHVRYFGYNNVTLRIQYDPVPMYEVVAPKQNVTWKVDSDLRLKNDQYLMIEEKLDCFMDSIRARIQGIHIDDVMTGTVNVCRQEVDSLMQRANEEHEWLKAKLQNKYMNSKYYEIIPMNRAIRAIQEKAVAWDETFAEFEHQFFPSESDIRRLARLQLKKFLERDESTTSLTSVDEGVESGAEEALIDEKGDSLALSPRPSDISPEQARDMLTSVVKEDHSSGDASANMDAISTSPKPTLQLLVPSPREALEREDVRHLDLAIASDFPDAAATTGDQLTQTQTTTSDPCQFDPGSPTPTSPPKVNPIDKSLAEAIENMPSSPSPAPTPGTTSESKIPRLMEQGRRETAVRPNTLTRTQSQPGNITRQITFTAPPPAAQASTSAVKPAASEHSKTLERMSERLGLGLMKQVKASSRIPRSIPHKNDSRVSKIAHHFEQLQREFQHQRMRERRNDRNRQMRAYPLASSKPIVEVYKNVHDAVQEHNESDDDMNAEPFTRASMDDSTLGDSTFTEATEGTTTASQSPIEERHPRNSVQHADGLGISATTPTHSTHVPSDAENEGSDTETTPEDATLPDSITGSQLLNMSESQLESSLELPRHEKNTLLKMITSFWSERSASGWTPLEYPFTQIEHVWQDSDIIIREDEPSSIIALALSCPDYVAKLQTFRDDNADGGGMETSDGSIERNLLHEKNHNIRYSFTNRGVKAQCKIFYAQSFDALRRKCGVADRFVESLSRCSKFDSKGGKSKSIFLKTLDDRFILKSLSPIEVQAFFKFGPNYFAFTHQNLFKSLPSVIAKMFGLFQVQIKTPTGRDFDWYMLVMENLFYDREPNRRYDLKGSMRNRKIQATGERDEVLLDENLVDIIYSETPIFVREHTKKLLKASVFNDTLFLSQNNVMDYSLMAGFDDTNREIIVGIIDCIRTYTWDKKLESWIKDRGKNKPTITSPKDYRNRFRIAMEKYILQAPNCWHQFSGRMVPQIAGVNRTRQVLEGVGADGGRDSKQHSRGVSGSSSTAPASTTRAMNVRDMGSRTILEAVGDEGVRKYGRRLR